MLQKYLLSESSAQVDTNASTKLMIFKFLSRRKSKTNMIITNTYRPKIQDSLLLDFTYC